MSEDSDATGGGTTSSSSKMGLLFDFSKVKLPERKSGRSLSDDRISKMNFRCLGKGLTSPLSQNEQKEPLEDEQNHSPAPGVTSVHPGVTSVHRCVTSVHVFLVHILFQAHRHEEALWETAREKGLWHTVTATQRPAEDGELEARLNSLREEEARRPEYEVDIMVIKEPVEVSSSPVTPSPPKEDTVVAQSKSIIIKRKKK